jgi:hypothetical protein
MPEWAAAEWALAGRQNEQHGRPDDALRMAQELHDGRSTVEGWPWVGGRILENSGLHHLRRTTMFFRRFVKSAVLLAVAGSAFVMSENDAEARCCRQRQRCHRQRCCSNGYGNFGYSSGCNACSTASGSMTPQPAPYNGYAPSAAPAPAAAPPPAPST